MLNMSFYEIFKTVVLSGAATVIATQILKQSYIPIPFEKFPRITAVLVSLVSAGIAVWQTAGSVFTGGTFWDWITVGIGTVVVATITYNNVLNTTSASKTTL